MMQRAAARWLLVLCAVGFFTPGFASAQCTDVDNDGYGDGAGCLGPDCDDGDPDEFPGQSWYADCDGDTYERSIAVIACDASGAPTPCVDTSPPDGGYSSVAGTDCNDEDASEFPGKSWYADCDADTFVRSDPVLACNAGEANSTTPCADASPPDGGYSLAAGSDCDDENPAIYPQATEIPGNGIDENCDGVGGPPAVPALGTPAWIALCTLLIAASVWLLWKRRTTRA